MQGTKALAQAGIFGARKKSLKTFPKPVDKGPGLWYDNATLEMTNHKAAGREAAAFFSVF